MTKHIGLKVGEAPISLDYFAQSFLDHTVRGMMEGLEGTAPVQDLSLTIDGDQVSIELNGTRIEVNAFAGKIIRNTLAGLVSSLKGVGDTKKMAVSISH
ncbi:MAG: hypothetical protein HYX90_09110 [Chloroflexi bacterium]|nr:hypothetical protein [Chloroflexota bacterium]